MTEPEVSLFTAMYYIQKGDVTEDVLVSLDGAHVSMLGRRHFDVVGFLREHGYERCDGADGWQGQYQHALYPPKIVISSKPGEGDVRITTKNGQRFFVESKKFKGGKSPERPAMHEAIGQLMTGESAKEWIPVVAVPYSEGSLALAERWCGLEKIRMAGIRFWLVCDDGQVKEIGGV